MKNISELLNPTIKNIKPSGIRKFFDIAEQMKDCITLGVGEPDFLTPWHIREAGIQSLQMGKTRYTSNWGLLSLRAAVADYMKQKHGLSYNPENEILITVGGSEAIDGCIRSVIGEGDEVLIPAPSFVCYQPLTEMAGGIAKIIETKVENEFRLTPEELRAAITDKTKLLILPYPNNPTGGIMRREDLEKIGEVLRETNILVLSDEIYGALTYGGQDHVSIAEIDGMKERTVIVNGFSKTYSMTGWRLGFACGPRELMDAMTKLHQYAIMSSPTTSQYAAIEALKNGDEDMIQMREEYNTRRRFVVRRLREMGLDCFDPQGAFYVFPCIKSSGLSSDVFCERLLIEKKVAVVPGTAFGDCGEGFIRISYCNDLSYLKTALDRIAEFLKELKKD